MIDKYETVKNILKNRNNYIYLCDSFIFESHGKDPAHGMNAYQHKIAQTILEDHKIILIIKKRSIGATTFLASCAFASLVFGDKNVAIYNYYPDDLLLGMPHHLKYQTKQYFNIESDMIASKNKISNKNNKTLYRIPNGINYPTIRSYTDNSDLIILDNCQTFKTDKKFDLIDSALFSVQNHKNTKLVVTLNENNSQDYLDRFNGVKIHKILLK